MKPVASLDPGAPQPRGLRGLRGSLARLWRDLETLEADDSLSSSPRRARWIRGLLFAVIVCLLPIRWLLGPLLWRTIFHVGAADKIKAAARELWATNPHEALALLKSVRHTLREAERSRRLRLWRGFVEVPPYGRCRLPDRFVLDGALYSYAFALADYETALAVCSEPPLLKHAVEEQVACLVAMKRVDDAITVLQANLHLDNRRGDLRRRLAELGGDPSGGLN